MKKVLILTIAIMLVAGVASAEKTSRGTYTSPFLQNWLNNNPYFYHDHSIDLNLQKHSLTKKLGLDAVLYQTDDDAVEVITTYNYVDQDFYGNNGHEIRAAVKVNFWDLWISKLFKK